MGEVRGVKGSDVQQIFLVLGALVTFLLFAPRGLIVLFVGLAVVFLLGARLAPRRKNSINTNKDLGLGHSLHKEDSESELGATGDGEWGPCLLLVFDAHDPTTGRQWLRIEAPRSKHGRWRLEPVGSERLSGSPHKEPDSFSQLRSELSSPPDPISCNEVLQRLSDAGLEYRLGPSRGGEYIFCAVRLPELTARANLSFYPMDLQLDMVRARSYAAELGMPLAIRATARSSVSTKISVSQSYRAVALTIREQGLPEEVWRYLHLRFVPTVPSSIFRHFILVPRACATDAPTPAELMESVHWDSDLEGECSDDGLLDEESGYLTLETSPVSLPFLCQGRTPDGMRALMTTILPPSMRLRLLLSLVADDLPGALGDRGPGLKLDQWRKPKLCNFLLRTFRNFGVEDTGAGVGAHLLPQLEGPQAFLLYFLMQDPRDAAYLRLCDKFGHPASPHFRRTLLSGIVDPELPSMLQSYFGHQIGFYFAFMQHLFGYGFALSVLLAPLLAVYSMDWAQHMVATIQMEEQRTEFLKHMLDGAAREIDSAQDSHRWPLWSLLVGISSIVWGQCVLESWKRQEQRLAREWGATRSCVGRTLRPRFHGRIALSRIDGRVIQVHYSRLQYKLRVLLSNCAFLLLGCAFGGVVLLFAWYSLEMQVADEQYASLGAVYSIVTITLFHLFKIVAHLLTEAENHKHEEQMEASVLVKKWMLTVIVQCWAVGHLLFLRPMLWPCAYGDVVVRQRLGVDACAPNDRECCDVELRRHGEVLLSFADVRGEAVLKHTRQFVAGWLVSKMFLHSLLKWFMPRLCGFMCMRGLYPLLPYDFARDLLNDLTFRSKQGRRRVRRSHLGVRCRCCRRRREDSEYLLSCDLGPSALPKAMTAACELQLDKQDPWDVLDTANDLSVHFLVTSLTTVIYPFAPVLFVVHLLVEFQMDLFRLFDRRQPKPRPARGLPKAWVNIFQSYVYVGAISNLAIVTWRTPLVKNRLGPENCFAFFSTSMLALVLIVSLVHLVVPQVPGDVNEHLERQQEVEAFFVGAFRQRKNTRQLSAPLSRRGSASRIPSALGPEVDALCEPETFVSPSMPAFQKEDAAVHSLWQQAQKVR